MNYSMKSNRIHLRLSSYLLFKAALRCHEYSSPTSLRLYLYIKDEPRAVAPYSIVVGRQGKLGTEVADSILF